MTDLAPMKCFLHPNDDIATSELRKCFDGLSYDCTAAASRTVLQWQGHDIIVPMAACGVAWFSFDDLCNMDYGAGDYIVIAKQYHTIIIADIPRLQMHQANAARRFITFLDSVYENKVRLLVSAQCAVSEIFSPQGTKSSASLDHSSRILMDDLSSLHSPSTLASALFNTEEETFAFRRTVSRLLEIQTAEYWRSAGPIARNIH